MIWPGAFSLTGPTALETIEGFVLDRLLLEIIRVAQKRGATMIKSKKSALARWCVRPERLLSSPTRARSA